MNRVSQIVFGFAVAGFLAGCGDSSDSGTTKSPGTPAASTAADDSGVVEQKDGVYIISLTGNDMMQYNARQFTVPAGAKVKLVLHHNGKMAVTVMGHNVVILNKGEDYQKFGGELTSAGGKLENEYLPESMRSRVFVFTKMIGGGETTEIEFTAPAAGEYPYLCTFPGHFGTMNGKMLVK